MATSGGLKDASHLECVADDFEMATLQVDINRLEREIAAAKLEKERREKERNQTKKFSAIHSPAIRRDAITFSDSGSVASNSSDEATLSKITISTLPQKTQTPPQTSPNPLATLPGIRTSYGRCHTALKTSPSTSTDSSNGSHHLAVPATASPGLGKVSQSHVPIVQLARKDLATFSSTSNSNLKTGKPVQQANFHNNRPPKLEPIAPPTHELRPALLALNTHQLPLLQPTNRM